jgi:hypothetical protein
MIFVYRPRLKGGHSTRRSDTQGAIMVPATSSHVLSYSHLSFDLPVELWLEVFHWITVADDSLYSANRLPFQPSFANANELRILALETRRAMALVCKGWYELLRYTLHGELYVNNDSFSQGQAAQFFNQTQRMYILVRLIMCLDLRLVFRLHSPLYKVDNTKLPESRATE